MALLRITLRITIALPRITIVYEIFSTTERIERRRRCACALLLSPCPKTSEAVHRTRGDHR